MKHISVRCLIVLAGMLLLSNAASAQKSLYLAEIEKSTAKYWRSLPSDLDAVTVARL